MKYVVSLLALVLAPAVLAGLRQTAPAEPVPQANGDGARSAPGKATSHDRHARKHRAGNHHRRPRVTAKSHNP